MKLAALEAADLTNEFSELSQDLSSGVRSTMQAITLTEQAVVQGVTMTKQFVTEGMMPFAKRRIQSSKDIVEHTLQKNAKLKYDAQQAVESMRKARVIVRRARIGVGVVGFVWKVRRGLRTVLEQRERLRRRQRD
eukprot:TRINITY_DN31642_c0_g1_i4.p4 TRINITY_DN31642_c0_g1~~TRINITY_DN31642_c0_g1_i4.p4  ORF type:complete len:135 (-),score=17.33 TRINITY_DN31642_c0_g1_i4:201-605(-)